MKEFFETVFGATAPGVFFGCVFFAMIGMLIMLLLGTKLRDPKSVDSPQVFSWKYLLSDNARRIIAGILCVLVTLRFMPDVLNMTLTPWNALCVGFGWDSILLIVKQKTSFLDPKK